MRYAIFSDIHGNLRAWEEALADIRAQQVDVLVCLGDAVGYGPKPEEVLCGIRAVTNNFIMGNHEAAAAGLIDYSIFNDNAIHSTEWTMQALSTESRDFLKAVPLAIDAGEIFFVHAEISEPGRFGYIDDHEKALENFTDSPHFVTFVGHTHHPKIYQLDGSGSVSEFPDQNRPLDPSCRYIVNVGSVGEPRNAEDLRGVYVIYDSETREVDFRRVAFDIEAYRVELESTTLNVRPFFLQYYDHLSAESQSPPPSAPLEMAMEAPAAITSPISQGAESVAIHVPSDNRNFRNPADEKRSNSVRKAMVLTLTSMLVVALIIWGVIYYNRSAEPDDSLVHLDDTSTVIADPEPTPDLPEPVPNLAEPVPDSPALTPKPPEPKLEPEAVSKPNPTPTNPSSKPEPKLDPKLDPKPIADPTPKHEPTVAWWRMGADSEGPELVDSKNKWSLPVLAPGKKIGNIAPPEIPPNDVANTAAMSLGVWAESSPSGEFALCADRSFTFEGWFLIAPSRNVIARNRHAIFLAGTRSGDANGKQGWHIDIRPSGQMSFYYDNGPKTWQALSKKLPVTDLKPHHFAAVWHHDASAGAGEMRLYLDGEKVATVKVPHAKIPATQANPFRIGAPKNPSKVGLDEVRFSRGALDVSEFLRVDEQSITQDGLVLNLVGDALGKIKKSVNAAHQPKLVQGKGLPVLRFDGKDDFLSIPDRNSLDLEAWTIISLIRPTGGPGVVLSKADGKSTMINYRLQIDKDGKVGAVVRGATVQQQVKRGAKVNVMKRFSVVAARFDPKAKGVNKVTISVDGVPAPYSFQLAKGKLTPITHNAPLLIGRQPGKDPRYFKGDVGGILLYNRALGDDELNSTVKQLLEQRSTGKTSVANKATKPGNAIGPKDAIVFLIAGQSNAGGVAAFSKQTNAKAAMQEKHPVNPGSTAAEVGIPTTPTAYPRSHIWKPQKGPFEKLTPGANLQTCYTDVWRHGIELPMAMLLEKKYPKNDIYFVKHAPAGHSLHTQWKAGNGSGYKKFIRQITPAMTDLKKRYKNVRVIGLYWDQGESDQKQARQYEGNLRKLFNSLRKDTGQPNLQIYVREQGIFQHDKPQFKYIVDAQVRIAKKDANTHLLKLDLGSNEKNFKAWAWSIGNGHLSSKAYLKLSKMIMASKKAVSMTEGAWQHVALVYKADGTVGGCLNGKKSHTVTSAFDFNSGKLGIGTPFLGKWGSPFVGDLDDFRVSKRELSKKDIKAMVPPELLKKAEANSIKR